LRPFVLYCLILVSVGAAGAGAQPADISPATQECLDCHGIYHPGIVADWQKSRHGQTSSG
jgi:hypothetical protein